MERRTFPAPRRCQQALDADSEEAIAAALRGLAGQTTVIAIAHRGLLRDMADRIVTLENGRLTIG